MRGLHKMAAIKASSNQMPYQRVIYLKQKSKLHYIHIYNSVNEILIVFLNTVKSEYTGGR